MTGIICPICGQYEFEEDFDTCTVCGWQYDRVQYNDPDYWGGANDLSINDYKKAWLNKNPVKLPARKTA